MDIVFMDSTTARRIGADVGRCGKKGVRGNAPGTETKIHVIMGERRPLRVHVSDANGHDSRMAYRMPDGLNLKAANDLLPTRRMIWRLKTQDMRLKFRRVAMEK